MQPIPIYMKKLLLTLTWLLMVSMSYADNETNLVIRQKAGNETIFSLESNPVITFEDEYLNVRNDFTSISFPIADIDQYSVTTPSGISEMRSQPRFANGQVTINDLPKGTKAYVHSLDGKVIREIPSDGMGTVTFSVRDLPKGTYVISAANTRFKIANK